MISGFDSLSVSQYQEHKHHTHGFGKTGLASLHPQNELGAQ